MSMEQARLALAIESVLEAEGGYKAPEPGDPNPTMCGITQATYQDFLKKEQPVASWVVASWWPSTVEDLGRESICEIYRWYLTGCSPYHDIRRVKPLVPMVMLAHLETLMGRSAGVRVLQRALNGFRPVPTRLRTDGKNGDRTMEAMERITPQLLTEAMEVEWAEKLKRIIAANPEKAVYRDGWMNRATGWQAGWKP